MRFYALLLATAALLLPATNASPTSILPSFLASWSEGLNSLRREPKLNVDDTTQFERRQATNPFDHNPDGSKFLWVLQDTYQGQTFFEYVIGTVLSIEPIHLHPSTVAGPFSRIQIQQSESRTPRIRWR